MEIKVIVLVNMLYNDVLMANKNKRTTSHQYVAFEDRRTQIHTHTRARTQTAGHDQGQTHFDTRVTQTKVSDMVRSTNLFSAASSF